ncbi:MAG TPA: UDP-2,3-diacylglucosamine hydrolase [Chitinophagaceae bacterium]|nr:UDP-2,3-diacylglucosamine hydrolase [Chitinophagaceae bacterium]
MSTTEKIYFLSDFHLGAPDHASSLIREKKIVEFLNLIRKDATEIFILGDMFDFWFEYSRVVPKGYVRLLGTLASITDSGIPIHFFIGNHDMWMKNYFQQEMNIQVYHEPRVFHYQNKKLLIGHGDGLGPGDHGYKMIKKIFRHPVSKWLFGVLPPYIGIGLADFFSRKSRAKTGQSDEIFHGPENEWLIQFAQAHLQKEFVDYFVFGHRHLPIHHEVKPGSVYINTGDWIKYNSYALLENGKLNLLYYNN